MNWILQFVLKQFAKKSARKTGVAQLLKANDPIVQSNVRNITIQLKNMGINPKNLTSTDDVLKAMNYHKAMVNQSLKQEAKGLGLFFDKSGVLTKEGKDTISKSLLGKNPAIQRFLKGEKKDPFQGWTPKLHVNPERIKQGFSTQMKLNTSTENDALIKSFIKRENTEFNSLSRDQRKEVLDMFDAHMRPKKPDMASGGIAGQLHLNEGGRAGFPFGGKALKAIRDAWRANKTWGVGGPPYKPEKTSFNIKEMTKRNLGKELSLTDLRRLSESPLAGPQKGHFEDFNKQFKNIKASILREKMMERKLEAKAMINAAEKTMKDATKEFESAFGPLKNKKKQHEMAKSITDQMTRQSKETLKEVREGLKEIDIYMGMLQKQGRRVHASGGLAQVLGV